MPPPFTRAELEAANAQFGPLDQWAWDVVAQWENGMPGPVSDTAPSLMDRMRALADSGHPRADDLRREADALDHICDTDVKRMIGTWARATRVWSECSGEPPI